MDDGCFDPLGGAPLHEQRPGVASPAAIGLLHNKFHTFYIRSRAVKIRAGQGAVFFRVDEHPDRFAAADPAYHLAVNPANRIEFAGPIPEIVGPCHPSRLVWFPLGRHREAEAARSLARVVSWTCH